jgi:transcription initiation factor TFIIB
MKEIGEKQISAGKDPMGLAATTVYAACLKTGEIRTQSEIASVSGITEVTIRNRYKELKTNLELNETKPSCNLFVDNS